MESVLQSGLLLHLSSGWLGEVYRLVVQTDLFPGPGPASPITQVFTGLCL